jgi:hypothetical protein
MSFNPIGTLSGWLGQQVPGQPGVGTTNQSNGEVGANDIPVPGQPGAFYNPQTGQIIRTSPGGNPYVAGAPNLADLTAISQANQLTQQQQQQKLQQQQQQTFQAQNDLAGTFKNTITNPGASSVALSQLGSGLQQIAGTQLGAAAGTSGENAAAVRRTAAQNVAGASVGLNAQQAALRAQEVANAQTGLSGLLNSQLGAENTGINTATSAGLGYGNQGITAQGDSAGIAEKGNEANAKANSNLLGTLGNGLAALGALA